MNAERLLARLSLVSRLSFEARSRSPTGWNGRGSGMVTVEEAGPGTVLWAESGTWQPGAGRELPFRNVFRWSLVRQERLRLEHLRFGIDHPVFLFELIPGEDGRWQSVEPHLCRQDCYSASLNMSSDHFLLRWEIKGPTKNEKINYRYSW